MFQKTMGIEKPYHPKPEELKIETPEELEEAKKVAGVIKEEEEIEFMRGLLEEEKQKPEGEQDGKLIEKLQYGVEYPKEWKESRELGFIVREKYNKELLPEFAVKVSQEIEEKFLEEASTMPDDFYYKESKIIPGIPQKPRWEYAKKYLETLPEDEQEKANKIIKELKELTTEGVKIALYSPIKEILESPELSSNKKWKEIKKKRNRR